jgi:hypothetical protein
MANPANLTALTLDLRHHFLKAWIVGLPDLILSLDSAARDLASHVAEPALVRRRLDAAHDLRQGANGWLNGITETFQQADPQGTLSIRMQNLGVDLGLADHKSMETDIFASRLALAMADVASSEFVDLRLRILGAEGLKEFDSHDILRPQVISRVVINSWCSAGLSLEAWNTLQALLHQKFSDFALGAYHEANHWLLSRGVRPEINLRPFVHRSRDSMLACFSENYAKTDIMPDRVSAAKPAHHNMNLHEAGEAVFGRLNPLVNQELPGFSLAQMASKTALPRLNEAIISDRKNMAEPSIKAVEGALAAPSTAMIDDLQRRKRPPKKAAAPPPMERATIELVAMLFQSILTEDRIPAILRIWFARLQIPVLRVAVGEPDFFATAEHPARRLIDRMGSSIMGFDSGTHSIGDALQKEIKRIVQVVEAYPDTGRRVFQTVLSEFEKFLEHYFQNENEASRRGVSLSQQVEQRETLAIQYTIELRKMLNEVPVQAGVRDFLFHTWADVLATTAVKSGLQSEETRLMKHTAADLIWSASTKVSRDERAEVICRLPDLLKNLRDGMQQAGVLPSKQDEHIQSINNALAAAFTAKKVAIPQDRLKDLIIKLETLEELLPEAADVEIDESMVLDLSGCESSELEVVAEGGSMPTAAMLASARELQVGGWHILDYRERTEGVRLAWQGLRRQLTLFVSPQGRCILFQQRRLAAFLQAGLLVSAPEEPLTTRPTRATR